MKVVSKNKKPFEEFVDTGRNPDAERGERAMPAMNSQEYRVNTDFQWEGFYGENKTDDWEKRFDMSEVTTPEVSNRGEVDHQQMFGAFLSLWKMEREEWVQIEVSSLDLEVKEHEEAPPDDIYFPSETEGKTIS